MTSTWHHTTHIDHDASPFDALLSFFLLLLSFLMIIFLFYDDHYESMMRHPWHFGKFFFYYFLFSANVSILWRQRWHVGTASPPTSTTSLQRIIRDILVSFFLLLSFLMLNFLFYDDYATLAPHHYPHPLRRVICDILVSFFYYFLF